MKKLTAMILTAILTVCALAGGALAETYRFEGTPPTFTATDYATGATLSVTAQKLVLLGLSDDGQVLGYADNTLFYIAPEQLSGMSSRLSTANLTELSGIADIRGGSPSGSVESVQRALTLLGYLSSSVDGSYGSRTATAVSAFQEDRGLEATGIADAITQRLLFSLVGAENVIAFDVDPSVQFAAIADRTDANLEPMQGKGLSFQYDDIAGTGFIGNGSSVSIASGTGTADLDSYTFTLDFGFAVAEGDEGVTVTPVVEIANTSVRRPIMQSLLLKSGDSRVTIKVTGVTSGVSDSKSVENGTVKLTAEALQLLKDCAANGELKARIVGKYNSYDVVVPANKLDGIAALGDIAVEMSAEG